MLYTQNFHTGVVASAAVAAVAILMLAVTDLTPVLRTMQSRAPADETVALERLYVPIETADGRVTSLLATNGHVRIATLFYTHCPLACPLTITAIRRLEGELTSGERARLSVLLLSLDPTRDSPAALAALRAQQELDGTRWMLGRTAPELLTRVAAAFNVHVARTSQGIDHTTAVLLLDAHGSLLARTQDVSRPDPRFVAAVRSALGVHGS